MANSIETTRILIVDDEALVAMDLEGRLKQLGYTICGRASTAEKALELVEQHQPDLVMMDIVLKGEMDGIDAAEVIRDKWGIPVIFLTAYMDSNKLERAKLTTPFGYILKPFKDRELKITVDMALYVAKVDAKRRKAEEALKESERQKALILNSTKELFAYYNLDFEILWCNQESGKSVGKTPEQLVGKRCYEVWQQRETPCENCPVQLARETGQSQEKEVETPDGRFWRLRGFPVFGEDSLIAGLIEFGQDITDRKQAEVAIRSSEKKYRKLLETLPYGVEEVDLEGRTVFLNDAYNRILGYDSDELVGTYIWEHDPTPESKENVKKYFEYIKREKPAPVPYLSKNIKKDGSVIDVEVTWDYVYDENVDLTGFISVVTDITERKQAEETLRENEKRYRQIFETNQAIKLIIDPSDGKIVEANDAACQFYGYDKNEITTKKIFDINVLSPEEISKKMAHTKSEDQLVFNFRHRLSTGEIRDVEVYSGPIWTNQGTRLYSIIHDVTERKRIEEKLRDNEKVLSDILEGVLSGYWDWNIPANEEYLSPSFKKMFGYKDHELPNIPETWQKLIFPEELPGVLENYDRHIKSYGKEPYYNEIRYRHKDGSTIWVICAGRVIEWAEDGSPIRMVGCHVDITNRKEAEEELKKYKQIVSSTKDAVSYLDKNYRYQIVNDAYENFSGAKKEELLGKTVSEYLGKDIFESEIKENFDKCLKDETVNYQMWVQYPTLGRRFVEVTYFPYRDAAGAINGIVANTKDITDRKRAEDALKESEDRFRALVESAPVSIMLIRDGKYIYGNPASIKYLGYKNPEEIVGVEPLETIAPEFHETVIERMKRLDQGQDNVPMEMRIIRPDGSSIWSMSSSVHVKISGKPTTIVVGQDITEQKLAKQALDESEARYRFLVETANEGIWFIDKEEKTIFVNQAMANILGYEPSEMLGKRIEDFTFPEDIRFHEERMQKRRDGKDEIYERRLRRKDGSSVYTIASAKALLDNNGHYDGSFAMYTDITERINTENRLKESEEKYRLLFSYAPSGIYEVDLIQNRILSVNDVALDYLGYSREELLSMDSFDLLGESSKKIFIERIERYSAGDIPPTQVECELVGKHGQRFWVVMNVRYKMSDDRVIGATVVVHDLTERKKAEEERYRLMAAIEQVDEIVVITDPNGNIQYVNPAFEITTGYSFDEVVGHNPNILKSGKQDESFYSELWQTILARETWSGRLVNKRKDGHLYTEKATISPVIDANEAIINFVAVKKDITNELLMENQFRQAQKMEAIGTLAGGIAHDFNNILAAMTGFTELSIHSLDPDAIEKTYLAEVLKAGKRAKGLVNQILTFSRSSDEDQKPIEVQPIIKETMKFLRASIPTFIELEQDITSAPTVVMGDPTHLNQIVMNLCTNAAHAIGDNVGKIKVSLERMVMNQESGNMAGFSPGEYVKLKVTDTGHGMGQETMTKLFDPFFTTKRRGEGTGLGLSVVHGIVTSMDGKIDVDSAPGQGTTISIFLPIIQMAPDVETVDQSPLEVGQESLLVVDDEEVLVEMARKMLEKLGYHVTCRTCPLEALKLFKENPKKFDLLITDQNMPNLTGLQLGEALKITRPDLPIILCTGFSEAVDQEKAKAMGFKEFLMKPVLIRDLAQAVRRALKNPSS